MRNKLGILSFIFLLACGTDTGNPGANPTSALDVIMSTTIDRIVSESCKAVARCHPVEASHCQGEWMKFEHIDVEIGLQEGAYKNLTEANVSNYNGSIASDPVAEELCLKEIGELSCEQDSVKDAYIESFDNPYLGGDQMLPQSCEGVFSN